MSISVNRVIIAGNLTRDPQVKFFANERAKAEFGMAMSHKYKSGEETKEETTFVDVECWGKTAELAGQYLTKGRACLVEGRLKLDQWEDKDGQKRTKLKVVADSIQFLDTGNRGGREAPAGDLVPHREVVKPAGPQKPAAGGGSAGVADDEPPFARYGEEMRA